MVSTDTYGVPVRKVFATVLKDVCNEAHRLVWRVDMRAPGNVFLKDVVLYGSVQVHGVYTLSLTYGDVKC